MPKRHRQSRAYIVMAHIVIACIVMAYIAIVYIVMADNHGRWPRRTELESSSAEPCAMGCVAGCHNYIGRAMPQARWVASQVAQHAVVRRTRAYGRRVCQRCRSRGRGPSTVAHCGATCDGEGAMYSEPVQCMTNSPGTDRATLYLYKPAAILCHGLLTIRRSVVV